MRVLLLNQLFWPDESPTSRLLTDVAAALAAEGHAVTVIAGQSQYATSTNSPKPPSVHIVRVPVFQFARSRTRRVLSYASYMASAAFRSLTGSYDVVLTLTTPPGLCLLGDLLHTVRGSRHYVWEMDLYPDLAQALGDEIPGPLLGVIGRLLVHARRRAAGVIALGECMGARLLAQGIDPARIHVADNWGESILPAPWPDFGRINILYSGNLGRAHEVVTLEAALPEIERDGRFRLLFTGGGALRGGFERYCAEEGFTSVAFGGYVDAAGLARNLGECHIGLVTQNPVTLGMLVPSKLYTNMAAGRPTLYVGPATASTAGVINRHGCGWHVDAGDSAGLVRVLRSLAGDPDSITEAGARARDAYEKCYTGAAGVARICAILKSPAGDPRSSLACAPALRP